MAPIDEAGGPNGADELFVQEELDDYAAKVLLNLNLLFVLASAGGADVVTVL
jgi:hypothetical protein